MLQVSLVTTSHKLKLCYKCIKWSPKELIFEDKTFPYRRPFHLLRLVANVPPKSHLVTDGLFRDGWDLWVCDAGIKDVDHCVH